MAHTVEWLPPKAPPGPPPIRAPRLASPALVLLAAASILEGYRWLNVIPAGEWRPSAVDFVALALPVAMVLTRPRHDGRRVVAAKVVAGAALILLAVTMSTLFFDPPSLVLLMAACDLLFAASSLAVVLANELYARRGA